MPRPRFKLRVALALTAIVAVVAWQYSIVLRRREAMEWPHTFIVALPARGHIDPGDLAKINPLRELLGDQAIQYVYVGAGANEDADVARLRALFPEAEVEVYSPPFIW